MYNITSNTTNNVKKYIYLNFYFFLKYTLQFLKIKIYTYLSQSQAHINNGVDKLDKLCEACSFTFRTPAHCFFDYSSNNATDICILSMTNSYDSNTLCYRLMNKTKYNKNNTKMNIHGRKTEIGQQIKDYL